MLLGLVSGVLAAAVCVASAQQKPDKMVQDCESVKGWESENNSPFQTVTEHVTQGKYSLWVEYTNKPTWSNVNTAEIPTDWSGYNYLILDVYSTEKEARDFGMWIRDRKLHKAEEQWVLGPGPNTLVVDLSKFVKLVDLDLSDIQRICIYKRSPEEITVYIDNIRLSVNPPAELTRPPVRMPDANLVANGGFEQLQGRDKVGNTFAWWTARRWEGASYLGRGKAAKFSGASSAMLDGRGPCKIGYASPYMTVESPTRLKLTFYVQAKDLKPGLGRATAAVTLTDAAENPLPNASIAIPEGTYSWKKVEKVIDVPGGNRLLKLFIQLYGPGQVWMDDMSLTGVDLAAAASPATFTDMNRPMAADSPVVSETPGLLAKKKAAEAALAVLAKTVSQAKTKGIETLYDEIPLMLGQLAFQVRWDLPQHETLRDGYCGFVLKRATESTARLQAVMAGTAPDLKVPPHPDFNQLQLQGAYYRLNDKPVIVFSMQYHRGGELTKWFCPEGYAAWVAAVGATRYDFHQSPVWTAYQKYPDTHRVYDGGWCGHIIRDQYSSGGQDNCVINLESPHMRQAIAESIATYCAERKSSQRSKYLYLNMGFEYSYVNYDSFSQKMFQDWLARKYGAIDKLNGIWKTKLADFAEIKVPSYRFDEPETNPAKYYDWGDFNLWRFTDYMKWAKGEIRKSLPDVPTTTGGGEPFGAGFWRQGIDEEGLVNEGVSDIWLSETGSRALGTTSVMDLQRSLSPDRLILDPEYHALPNTCFLMFLHGCSIMDYWWWPDQPGEFYESSMKHSDTRTLPEVEAVMRTGLDVRRIPEYIAPFPSARAELALLYSRESLIQQYPTVAGNKTPYTFEIAKCYEAITKLDAPVGFVSSAQVNKGQLSNYKIVVVPCVRYMDPAIYNSLLNYATDGGTVVITPTSLIADQYNRKQMYLKNLGIEILSEEFPEYMGTPAKRGIDQSGELDFIQGPISKTVVTAEPKQPVLSLGSDVMAGLPRLEGAGILQKVKADDAWRVLARYPDGSAAILMRSWGKGRIYYLAAQLDLMSSQRFFDRLMQAQKIARPIRAYAVDGVSYNNDVESRTVPFQTGYLTYLHNWTGKTQTVMLRTALPVKGMTNLNRQRPENPVVQVLEPYETRILKVDVR